MAEPVWPNDPGLEPEPPAPKPEGIVNADGWWPDIDLAYLRDTARLNQTKIPTARLREAVQCAILDIGDELDDWRKEQGQYSSLADVPAKKVDGQSALVVRWIRAVNACVAADLGERLLGQSSTAAGQDRAAELLTEADLHRRNVVFAVRQFLGRTRVVAELI